MLVTFARGGATTVVVDDASRALIDTWVSVGDAVQSNRLRHANNNKLQ